MDLIAMMQAVRRHWYAVLACVAVSLMVAAAVDLSQTTQYRSETRLFASTPGASAATIYQAGAFAERRVISYADLASSDAVLSEVVDELNLDRSAQSLASHVVGEAQPDTVVLSIAVTDPDPELAAQIADTVAKVVQERAEILERTRGDVPALSFTVVDGADVPSNPDSPRLLRDLLLAGTLGLIVGFAFALLLEATARRRRQTEPPPPLGEPTNASHSRAAQPTPV